MIKLKNPRQAYSRTITEFGEELGEIIKVRSKAKSLNGQFDPKKYENVLC